MTYTINGYEPERLFHFFEEISAIPRGSGNEKAASDYLVAFARGGGGSPGDAPGAPGYGV